MTDVATAPTVPVAPTGADFEADTRAREQNRRYGATAAEAASLIKQARTVMLAVRIGPENIDYIVVGKTAVRRWLRGRSPGAATPCEFDPDGNLFLLGSWRALRRMRERAP